MENNIKKISKNKQKKIRIKNRIIELENKILDLMESFYFEKYDAFCRDLLEEEINKLVKRSNVWFSRSPFKVILRLEPNWNFPKMILYNYYFKINLMELINDEK